MPHQPARASNRQENREAYKAAIQKHDLVHIVHGEKKYRKTIKHTRSGTIETHMRDDKSGRSVVHTKKTNDCGRRVMYEVHMHMVGRRVTDVHGKQLQNRVQDKEVNK